MKVDLAGKRFGRLVVVELIGTKRKRGPNYWRCVCDCGKEIETITASLTCGRSRSCGCSRGIKHIKHGDSSKANGGQSPLYAVWQAMRQRCKNKNNRKYHIYGGKGVEICSCWDSYKNFKKWAIVSGYKGGLSIDRIDPNGNYEPSNCRWITLSENSRRGTINRNRIYGNPSAMVHSDDLVKL